MDAVDDAQLMKLAAHRPHPILPVLNRTESIKPVILLLAALPGLIVLESQPIDQMISRWGLRAVDVLTATNALEAVAPGRIASVSELQFEPPLATWLTVAAMRLLGPAHPLSATIVSYFAAAGVLGMAYVLFSRLAGGRVGFWTVVLLAGHPSGLELFRAPPPVALTLLCAMIVWWAVVRHRDEVESAASVSLLIAGVALGLCLLSGGIVAAAFAGLLAMAVYFDPSRAKSRHSAGNGIRRRKKRLSRSIVPLIAVLLTAFAVAGWWPLMLGSKSWHGWMPTSSTETGSGVVQIVGSLAALMGVFGVASIVGLARAIGIRRRGDDGERPKRMTLIVVWAIAAGCLYAANTAVSTATDWRSSLVAGFLLIPLLACAANLLDDVFQRRLGLNAVAVLTFVSLLSVVALPYSSDASGLIQGGSLQIVATAAIAAILAGGLICRYAARTEHRRRFAIGGLIGVLLVCNVSSATYKPYDGGPPSDERELKAFMAGIPKSVEVDRCLLVARARPSVRIEFAVRSRWPNAEFSTTTAWNSAFRDDPGNPSVAGRRTLVVEWMTAKEHPTKIEFPGFKIVPVATPRYYRHKDLRAFHIRPENSSGKP